MPGDLKIEEKTNKQEKKQTNKKKPKSLSISGLRNHGK